MDAFTKAFGPKKQVIEGEIDPAPAAPQDAVMSAMLKKLMPGMGGMVQKMADDIAHGLQSFDRKLDTIITQNERILALLEKTNDDGK